MTSRNKKTLFLLLLWGGIAVPLVVIGTLVTLVATDVFGALPSFAELENPKSNIASEVYSEDGKLLGTFHIENRSFVVFDDLSPYLVRAVIATEDARFAQHAGVDIVGLFRVAVRTVALGDHRQGGGSTITQQLAKNLFPRDLNEDGNYIEEMATLVLAKLKEWVTAVRLERSYTKNEILAMYLNVVSFGSNAYGIRAAAQTFFAKTPSQLIVEEAALMAGVINAPTRYSPVRNAESALARRNFVMRRMVKVDYLTQDIYDQLSVYPIKLKYQQEDHNTGIATYFRERVRQIMLAKKPNPAHYSTPLEYKVDSTEWVRNPLYGWCNKNKKLDGSLYDINRDGLKIYTTVNARMQQYAEQALESHLKNTLQPSLNAEIRSKGGRIWGSSIARGEQEKNVTLAAIRQSERYRMLNKAGLSLEQILENFNTPVLMTIFTWQGEVEKMMTPLDSIKYYKAFLRAAFMAMDPHTGHVKAYVGGPNFRYFKYDLVRQSKRQIGSTIKPFVYTLAMQEGYSPCHSVPNIPQTFVEGDSTWTPRNATASDRDGKMVTLKWGLALSVNYISAWVTKQFNPQSIAEVAHKMGITSYIPPVNSIFLGTAEMTLYELVNAYATFANKGVRVNPVMVTRIEDRNGNVLSSFGSTEKSEAISEKTAYLMTNLLQYVVDHGTARRLRTVHALTGPIGGKTGTTQNQSDGWFASITPNIAAGVWVGCEDRSVHFESLGTGGGSSSALPIFGMFWQKVLDDHTLPYYKDVAFDVPLNMPHINLDCNATEYQEKNNSLEEFSRRSRTQKTSDEFF